MGSWKVFEGSIGEKQVFYPQACRYPLIFTSWQSKMLTEFINGFRETDDSGPKTKRWVDLASNKVKARWFLSLSLSFFFCEVISQASNVPSWKAFRFTYICSQIVNFDRYLKVHPRKCSNRSSAVSHHAHSLEQLMAHCLLQVKCLVTFLCEDTTHLLISSARSETAVHR